MKNLMLALAALLPLLAVSVIETADQTKYRVLSAVVRNENAKSPTLKKLDLSTKLYKSYSQTKPDLYLTTAEVRTTWRELADLVIWQKNVSDAQAKLIAAYKEKVMLLEKRIEEDAKLIAVQKDAIQAAKEYIQSQGTVR